MPSVKCLSCGEEIGFIAGRGWCHTQSGGGSYQMFCKSCGWKGAPTPTPDECPDCGDSRQLRDGHIAVPDRRLELQEHLDRVLKVRKTTKTTLHFDYPEVEA